ncbi:MAG: hypothetical protein AABX61_03825 [Nanoarchaeota archaeon]
MQKPLEEKALYVGFDDSNHAGKREGEVATAIFSLYYEDSLVKKFNKRSHTGEIKEWLSAPGRDYRAVILKGKRFRETHNNLPYAAPFLVNNFLESFEDKIIRLELHFDGQLKHQQISELKKSFSYIPEVYIAYYVKKQGIHNCPKVVYMADIQSHLLYEEYDKLIENDRIISF